MSYASLLPPIRHTSSLALASASLRCLSSSRLAASSASLRTFSSAARAAVASASFRAFSADANLRAWGPRRWRCTSLAAVCSRSARSLRRVSRFVSLVRDYAPAVAAASCVSVSLILRIRTIKLNSGSYGSPALTR